MLWIVFGLMCLAAIAFAVRPLLAARSALAAGSIVAIAVLSALVYAYTGSPEVPSGRGTQPDVNAMVASLAARLEREPDNLEGWKMLGRSYMTLGDFAAAIPAYERAVALEGAQNAQTLVDLGVAHAQANGQQLTPQAAAIFENAIALDPSLPEALFWSGIGAFNRGDRELAVERWQRLLDTDLPPEIRPMIAERVAVWSGEPVPETGAVNAPSSAIVRATLRVSDAAAAALPGDATVFVIARNAGRPGPPIAVTRRRLADLPLTVELSDRDSMIPGQNLSAFPEIELVARVSLSGEPAARSGDWFGSQIVRPADGGQIEITIDTQVP